MLRPAFYIAADRDIDLYGLMKNIGEAAFRRTALYCIYALFDASFAGRAQDVIKDNAGHNRRDPVTGQKNGGGLITVRLFLGRAGELNKKSIDLLHHVSRGSISLFIKTVIRQVIGPAVLLTYFLDDASLLSETGNYFIPLSIPDADRTERNIPVIRKEEQPVRKEEKKSVQEEISAGTGNRPVFPDIQPPVSGTPIPEQGPADSDAEGDMDILDMLESML